MVLIRGNDQYMGVEIAGETTWGADPIGGYSRVHPLLEESLTIERQPFPRSKELGAGTGALGSYDAGRQLVRGSFTVYPVYNAPWFAKLMSHAHGGTENVQADKLPNGATPGATLTTAMSHYWAPQSFRSGAMAADDTLPIWGSSSGIPPGLSIRVWKAGPSLGSTDNEKDDKTVEVYSGCIITNWRWEQPEDDRPKVTFTFIGRASARFGLGDNVGCLRIKHLPKLATTATNGSPAWTGHTSMLLSDGSCATSAVTAASLVLGTFGVTAFPASAGTILGIQAIVEAYGLGASPTISLELSVNGGSNWSAAKTTSTLSSSVTTYYVGTSVDLWGNATVSVAQLDNTNLKVRVKAAGTGTEWGVDSVRLQVFCSVTGPLPAAAGQVEVGMRDFYNDNANAYCGGLSNFGWVVGSKATAIHYGYLLNLRGFTLNFDGHVDAPPSFLTSIDTIEKPGHVESWEMTGTIASLLEQDYATVGKPKWIFLPSTNTNNYPGLVRFRYASQSDCGGTGAEGVGYQLDLFVPRAILNTVKDSADSEGVIQVAIEFAATLGEILPGETSVDLATGEFLPVPWLIQTLDLATAAYGL